MMSMRTTVSIPDDYYSKLKPALNDQGYATVNELLLDLIRHHFDEFKIPIRHQIDADKKPVVRQSDAVQKNVIKTPEDAIKKVKEKEPEIKFCKHGSMVGLCRFGCV